MSEQAGTGDDLSFFGHEAVPPEEKRRRVAGVFRSVARRYDLMNDLMSAGIHRLWKTSFIHTLDPRPGMRILDVAGGTGDIAFRAHAAARGRARIVVADLSEEMIGEGRRRAAQRGLVLDWVVAAAERLPFADRRFDAYAIAFGIRNVGDRAAALTEARRVLRFGGHVACLEFSKVAAPLLDRLYEAYAHRVIPRLGELVVGDRESYQYLVDSIDRFPDPESFADELRRAGFGRVRYRLLSGGICAIHEGWRVN